jgi:hypothetical protein
MVVQLAPQVRQVEVTDPVAAAGPYDYADAIEAQLAEPDPHSPEKWVRAGLGTTSGTVKKIVRLLGIRPAPPAPDRVGPFRIVASGPDLIHLETSLPMMRVVMVGRRVEPTRRLLTTILYYERPVLARLVWTFVGPAHRRTARQVIRG